MKVPEAMKHNKFVAVRIPTPEEVFGRVGLRPTNPSGYTGDESLTLKSKLDSIREEADRQLAELRALEESRHDE